MVVPSIIYEEDNKVYISKTCPEHGKFIDLYWGDYELYVKAEMYSHARTGLR